MTFPHSAWAGRFRGPDGAIEKALKYGDLSVISSNFYAASSYAASQPGRLSKLWAIWWLMRAAWYSERFAWEVRKTDMTVGQIDVRAAILARCFRLRVARDLLDFAASYRCDRENPSGADITLRMNLAMVLERLKDERAAAEYTDAMRYGLRRVFVDEPGQEVRARRDYASWLIRTCQDTSTARKHLQIAMTLIDEHKIESQRDRVEALLRKVS